MPLESCMILLDNSEYMRNGDYIPTRLEAQQDAANLLVGAKTQSHPESTVGVSAGTELLVSPTDDVGKILGALHGLSMRSEQPDVTASVQVASLALKHRRNKNGSQRIVLFVGSPLAKLESRALAKAGRQLKKNNVAIDVVAMGELDDNEEKLRELVDAANGRTEEGGERTCHLVTIPSGVLPSDVLASSPIVHGSGGGSGFAASAAAAGAGAAAGADFGGGTFAEFGGVDPNMDPELAMALRVSMEEERARQERAAAAAADQPSEGNNDASNEGEGGESKDAEMTDAAPAPAPSAAQTAMDMGLSEEEALLQQALAMSMNENEPDPTSATEETKEAAKPPAADTQMDVEDDEDAAMQAALAMSMQPDAEGNEEAKINELVGSIPGVDANDPAIQNALKKDDAEKKDGDKKE
ncbi:ATPase regulatory subunit 4 [Seminavis robusta]|uniref:ATPase regulatory subunit 4 n=1 Tax=Seminavis robusta TaxID=568900 RepID=A0A9N8DDR0_9STRA|nr:ATPase regulatory subunit 4 [Seminavis robusta]|eukprot:Sro26_g017520.1 ATPase regulatory subunit 4 (412) ;mRNA; r:43974-45379